MVERAGGHAHASSERREHLLATVGHAAAP
jgi:hypothetical protein